MLLVASDPHAKPPSTLLKRNLSALKDLAYLISDLRIVEAAADISYFWELTGAR
jgi:hypothetical protein